MLLTRRGIEYLSRICAYVVFNGMKRIKKYHRGKYLQTTNISRRKNISGV